MESPKRSPTTFSPAIKKYCKCIPTTPVISSCKIPIEHSINLTDDIPGSLPAIGILCSIKNVVKKRVSELLERDFLTCHHHPTVPALPYSIPYKLFSEQDLTLI